jgi:hypothetical protein
MDQSIPNRLRELLDGSDLYSFTAGGCHIFAAELQRYFSQVEKYQLAILVEATNPRIGIHVVAQSDDLVVDALGVRSLKELETWYSGLRGVNLILRPVSYSVLFETSIIKNGNEPKNAWGHDIHPGFVQECRCKANEIIEQGARRYEASLYRAGREITALRNDVTK